MSDTISADPELVRAAMKRLGNVAEIVESGRRELPAQANVCVAVPEVAAGFQSAFERAVEKIVDLAEGTQVQLAGNAQNIWKAAEALNAVDTDIADALVKTEASVADLSTPAATGDAPVVYATTPSTSTSSSATPAVPTVGGTGGER